MKKILILADETTLGKYITQSFALGFESNNCKVLFVDLKNIKKEEIKLFKPDLFFACNLSFLKNEIFLNIIKSLNCKKALFYKDSSPIPKKDLISAVELLKPTMFVSNKTFLKKIQNSYFSPLAASPIKYSQVFSGYKYPISFVGNPNKENRIKFLAALIKRFSSEQSSLLHIFCQRADFEKSLKTIEEKKLLEKHELAFYEKSYGGFLQTEEELSFVYNSSKINLDFKNKTQTTHYRVFETLASGGFLLAEETQELKSLFCTGKELETFKNIEELIDKIDFYLNNLNLSQRIAQLGRLKCAEKHTFGARAKIILKKVF